MISARREMTSAEQLAGLREARDRYNALADKFRDEGDPLVVMEEKLKHERDARRIANAYEKSIANIVASSTLMQQAKMSAPSAGSIGVKIAVLVIFVIASGAAYLAVGHPEIYRHVLTYLPKDIAARFSPAPVLQDKDAAPAAIAVPVQPVTEEPHAPNAHRPAPAVQIVPPKIRPAAKPVVTKLHPLSDDEGGFVAQVLQPDGTFKEQRFTAKPRR
jgi:hypothetical protein